MKQSQSNPVIIRENKLEADSMIQQLQEEYLPAVKSVCVKLKSLGVNQFPLSAVTDAISGNFDQVNTLFSQIIGAEKATVQGQTLKASIEADMSSQFSGLVNLVGNSFAGNLRNDKFFGTESNSIFEIKNIRSRLIIIPKTSKSLFQFIELNDQLEPVLDEGKIRELFADVATEKQAAIIEAQTNAAKYLTEFFDALIANGQRHDAEIILGYAKKFFSVKMDSNTGRYDVIPNTEVIALL
jgi:hypothetical protein